MALFNPAYHGVIVTASIFRTPRRLFVSMAFIEGTASHVEPKGARFDVGSPISDAIATAWHTPLSELKDARQALNPSDLWSVERTGWAILDDSYTQPAPPTKLAQVVTIEQFARDLLALPACDEHALTLDDRVAFARTIYDRINFGTEYTDDASVDSGVTDVSATACLAYYLEGGYGLEALAGMVKDGALCLDYCAGMFYLYPIY